MNFQPSLSDHLPNQGTGSSQALKPQPWGSVFMYMGECKTVIPRRSLVDLPHHCGIDEHYQEQGT